MLKYIRFIFFFDPHSLRDIRQLERYFVQFRQWNHRRVFIQSIRVTTRVDNPQMLYG
jgi:hypothetical protein